MDVLFVINEMKIILFESLLVIHSVKYKFSYFGVYYRMTDLDTLLNIYFYQIINKKLFKLYSQTSVYIWLCAIWNVNSRLLQACCDVAFEYAHTRQQFSQYLAKFQMIQVKQELPCPLKNFLRSSIDIV